MKKALVVGIALFAVALGTTAASAGQSTLRSPDGAIQATAGSGETDRSGSSDRAGDQDQVGEADQVGETGDEGQTGEPEQATETGGQDGEADTAG